MTRLLIIFKCSPHNFGWTQRHQQAPRLLVVFFCNRIPYSIKILKIKKGQVCQKLEIISLGKNQQSGESGGRDVILMYQLSEAFPKQQPESVIADDKVAHNPKWPLDAHKSRVKGTSASDDKVTRIEMIRGKGCCSCFIQFLLYIWLCLFEDEQKLL